MPVHHMHLLGPDALPLVDQSVHSEPSYNEARPSSRARSSSRRGSSLRTEAHRTQNPGTGLQPSGRWAEFSTPYDG